VTSVDPFESFCHICPFYILYEFISYSSPVKYLVFITLFLYLIIIELASSTSSTAPKSWPDLILVNAFENLEFQKPVQIKRSLLNDSYLYVATLKGEIFKFKDDSGVSESKLFLDIKDRVRGGGDKGFMDFEFHPRFSENGQIYVYYVARGDETNYQARLSRFTQSIEHPDIIDGNSEEIILKIDHPYNDHKAGSLLFGPDGYLYFCNGDGGINVEQGYQATLEAQNTNNLLGTMIRIDVDHRSGNFPYSIPKDNPFVGNPDVRDEIWAYGLRAPWRFCFEPDTGSIWYGDNGQWSFEEINIILPGKNYGWPHFEGFNQYDPSTIGGRKMRHGPPDGPKFRFRDSKHNLTSVYTEPLLEYRHKETGGGKSVVGGLFYTGNKFPNLQGAYLFSDYVSGQVWALRWKEGRMLNFKEIHKGPNKIISFGVDQDDEILVTTTRGQICRFELDSDEHRNISAVPREARLYEQHCAMCHTLDGSKFVGPSLKHFFKQEYTILESNEKIKRTQQYFINSLRNPNENIVKEYFPMMPAYSTSQISDRDIEGIIQYIREGKRFKF